MGRILQGFGNLVKTRFNRIRVTENDPNQWVGKTILASKELDDEPEEVVIQTVKGCLGMGQMSEAQRNRLVKSFEINGTHIVSIYSFYVQILEGRLPTPEEEAEFELATQITKIKEIGPKDGSSQKEP